MVGGQVAEGSGGTFARRSGLWLWPNESTVRAASNFARAITHPALSLLGVSVCLAFALRSLFFAISAWLWHFASDTDLAEVVPWARWAMADRDGAEAYALLFAIGLQGLATALCMMLLARLRASFRAGAVALLLAAAAAIAWNAPPRPPAAEIFITLSGTLWFIAGALLVTALVTWLGRRSRARVPALVAAVLVPVCFVPISYVRLPDLICILGPALRLQYGIRLSDIYLQYDLLPSLLALGWTSSGASPVTFGSVFVPASFYALFMGVYLIARRLLRAELAAPLLVSVVLIRFYGIIGDVSPQVGPVRLDLWVLPLGLVLAVGLRHWSVGLLLGALCFFSRSIGMLYLGAYGLAVALDFLAQRRASGDGAAIPFRRALAQLFIGTAPVWGIVMLCLLAVRLAFGSFGSDAVAIYHQLGVGMMRIDRTSFYWWLLALTGAAGWLAFTRRARIATPASSAAIFAVTLMVSSSIYFFGRSHELNLLNTSASYLFCFFLCLHLAWPEASDAAALRGLFRATPWLVVATCAYFYSYLGVSRTTGQFMEVVTQAPLLQASSGDAIPTINCAEVTEAAGDNDVVFFSSNDYWYYKGCHLVPRGYVQPLYLSILEKPLAADLAGLLRKGYKVVVPHVNEDFVSPHFGEFVPKLPPLDLVKTANFDIYRLRH